MAVSQASHQEPTFQIPSHFINNAFFAIHDKINLILKASHPNPDILISSYQ